MAGPSNVFDSQRGKITPLFSILGSQCFTVGGGGGGATLSSCPYRVEVTNIRSHLAHILHDVLLK